MNLWLEHLQGIPDPRRQSALLKHPLWEILTMALCAMLSGAESFEEFEWWGHEKQEWLRERLGLELPSGIPSHDTFRRVLAQLNPEALGQVLVRWTQALQSAVAQSAVAHSQATPEEAVPHHLAIDGKRLRGTWEAASQVCALTTVSLWSRQMQMTLAQAKVPEGGSELSTLESLFALVEVQGAVISGDAFYCQKDVARQLVERKADYVLALKENHGGLYREVKEHFIWLRQHPQTSRQECDGWSQQRDYEHGRHEVRRTFVLEVNELDWPLLKQQWPGVRTLLLVERQHKTASSAKTTVEQRFYLSSLGPDASLLAETVRGHWSIENSLHWVLDMAFEEDRCRTRRDNAAHNLATLRRLALNLLRQKPERVGLKARRKACGWNNDYLFRILTGIQ